MNLPDFLTADELGYVHLTGHRIGLVDIVYLYKEGDSAEMLHLRFPTLPLHLIHKVLGCYLENEKEVEEYCRAHDEEVDRVGGGVTAPVLPHHRTYFSYPAVSIRFATPQIAGRG